MKYMILFLTLFISTVLSSQNMTKGKINIYDLDNYHISNCKVTWINIFETNLSAKEIKKAIELKNITNFKEFDDKTLLGEVSKISVLGGRCNYREYISEAVSYKVRIDIKDGKYRVTISDVLLYSFENKALYNLEWYVLNKECEFKNPLGISNSIRKILTCYLLDTYTISESNDMDNW